MIKRAVSHDGTVIFDAATKDRTPRCPKCQARSPSGRTFHYVTCPLWKAWQQELRVAREQNGNSNTPT